VYYERGATNRVESVCESVCETGWDILSGLGQK
jgi:hypothetical protein